MNEVACVSPFLSIEALKDTVIHLKFPELSKFIFFFLKLSTDPISVHDVSFAFLLPFTRRTLLQNGIMCNLILWIFQRGIVVDRKEMRGVIFQLALWKWPISNSFRFIYEAIFESVFITEDGPFKHDLKMGISWIV